MRPLNPIDAATFSELHDLCRQQRGPVGGYKANGSFIQQKRNGDDLYWYYRGYERTMDGSPGKATLQYAGRVGDPDIEAIVAEHARQNANYKTRRNLVSRLKRAGLPTPHPTEGAVTGILVEVGILAAGSTLVGSAAFQTYGGLLGVVLEERQYRTKDIDIAQPRRALKLEPPLSVGPDLLAALQASDETFHVLHHANEPKLIAGYANADQFRLEFLTPVRADRNGQGGMAKVAGLLGVGAQQLKFLEFVLKDPVDSVMLHEAGIAVPVPAPARYAVHKLIVAASRGRGSPGSQHADKALKDVLQAQSIIGGMQHARTTLDLGEAWLEAWNSGPSWKKALRAGTLRLSQKHLGMLAAAVNEAAALNGWESPFHDSDNPRAALLGNAPARTPAEQDVGR